MAIAISRTTTASSRTGPPVRHRYGDSAEQIYMPYHLLPFWRSVMEHHKFLTVRATAAAAWPLCCLGPRQTAVAWTA